MTTDPTPEPRDASELSSTAAREAWAEAARPVLEEAAGRYRALVTYKQLAAAVQKGSGVTTTQPMHEWLGDVLDLVIADCESRGEPLLSALCVSVQGSVGEVYADSVEHARGERPTDPDDHAANERLACYRHWEAEGLPGDGGVPLRTAHFKPVKKAAAKKAPARVPGTRAAATPRKVANKAAARVPGTAHVPTVPKPAAADAPEVRPVPMCPKCFTQVPSTGICDYCD